MAQFAVLRIGQRDVRDPLAMYSQRAQFHDRVQEFAYALGELILVGQKSHQHADRERASDDRAGAEENDQDAVEPEQESAGDREDHVDLADAQLGAYPVHQVVVPSPLTPVSDRQRLDARHTAQRFEKMRVFIRGIDDRLFIRPTIKAIGQAAHHGIYAGHAGGQEGEPRIVEPHHAQQDEPHHAVHYGGD